MFKLETQDQTSGAFATCSGLMVAASTTPMVKEGFNNLSMMSCQKM